MVVVVLVCGGVRRLRCLLLRLLRQCGIARECFHVLSHNTTTRPVKRMNGVVRCVVRSHCHLGPEQEISWHLYYM